ncbi:YhgE/Pip domain-containing protein [Adlercreutzia sp. ZJ473]|uniref:YhgE/Pip family protein n=1 Tax=Adlercreutzia sp. ZJ473 TaxID=2722822 RepID=UPI0015530707
MRNVWTLFRSDMKRLFANVVSIIIVVGLVVMPSIFTWYNVIACWDVFGNTGNLKVAVANVDEGYESDLVPLRVNVGEQVVSALRANDEIDWVFTSEADAVDGARSGRYYAAVVIPASFSRDMLTFYAADAQHAKIVYYANEKKNAIAPKVTDKGADSVSYQVNEVFAETLSELALGIAEAFAAYADDADLGGRIGELSGHMRAMASQMDEAARVLLLYGKLASTSGELVQSSSDLVASARAEAEGMAASLPQDTASVTSLVEALKASVKRLSDALDASASSFGEVSAQIDALFDAAASESAAGAERLRAQAGAVADQAALYRKAASELEALVGVVPADQASALQGLAAMTRATAELLEDMSARLASAADKLEAGNADVQAERDEVKALAASAEQKVADVKRAFDDKLIPVLDDLAADATAFSGYVEDGKGRLDAIDASLAGSAGSVADAISDGAGKLDATAADLGDLAGRLRGMADAIDAALASGDVEALRAVLGSDVQGLSRALAAPVGVERVAVFPSENFGSAMSPLYATLALFIGALLILVVVKPTVSPRAQANLANPKPRELLLGRFGVMAFISLLQSTLLGLGNLFFLQVQVAHPWLYLLCFWVAGLVFTAIVYALVSAFANLGKAMAVLLLIIQVTGCGGSFPLQILPGFVQALSGFLPATHVVGAMRAAMFGTYGNDYWVQLGELMLFLVPAAFIGLVLRKPLAAFMGWYIEKVEDSKLVK